MKCPNCGAPVRGNQCEYCGSYFDMASDPAGLKYEYERLQNELTCALLNANQSIQTGYVIRQIPINRGGKINE